jgi:hypothetical protein
MKIEIKPFNGVVRFAPAIVFLRLKKNVKISSVTYSGWGRGLHWKISSPVKTH